MLCPSTSTSGGGGDVEVPGLATGHGDRLGTSLQCPHIAPHTNITTESSGVTE